MEVREHLFTLKVLGWGLQEPLPRIGPGAGEGQVLGAEGTSWFCDTRRDSTEVLRKSKGRLGAENTTFISVLPLTQEATEIPRVWFLPSPHMPSPVRGH